MVEVRWEDPPTRRTNWTVVVERLQERPGHWARILEPTTTAKANHYYRMARKYGAEAVVRQVHLEGAGVWARWPEST